MVRDVLIAFGRALLSQLHFRMLMLTVLPFLLSVLLWGAILWLFLQPALDTLREYFAANDGFRFVADVLGSFGMQLVGGVLVPFVAMWLLLPLMILTALVFVGTVAMPAVARHVGRRDYPELEQRKGGSLLGSLAVSFGSFLIFMALWIVTLPLNLIPPLPFVIQPVLWGWLTYRVMTYDALAGHASEAERREIVRRHRWALWLIGIVGGVMGVAPTLLWLGGAWLFLLPVTAPASIWLYVLVFVFTSLWFEHYCLEALARYRADGLVIAPAVSATPVLKDIN
jgi:uncharacterized protein involved in cysteine biosynthesis